MIDKNKPYWQVIKEQREEHGRRVEARQKEKYDAWYGRYGWREGLATPLRDLKPATNTED